MVCVGVIVGILAFGGLVFYTVGGHKLNER